MAKLSKAELAKREDLIQSMKKNKRALTKKYGADAEKVMYGRATNLAKKLAEQDMETNKLREMVKAALAQPMSEKKEFPDLTGDGKVTKADILKARGVELDEGLNQAVVLTDQDHENLMKNGSVAVNVGGETVIVALKNFDVDLEDADYEDPYLGEDIDLGHVDNEPHMIKAELYRIGKYAMELYSMLEELEEAGGEFDFPAWWQAKITTAMNNMVSSKHYLDFELKEPEIDAAVDAMTGEEPEMEPQVMTVDLVGDEDEIEEGLPKGFWKKETAELGLKEQNESLQSIGEKLEKELKALGINTRVYGDETDVPMDAKAQIEKNPNLAAFAYWKGKGFLSGKDTESLEVLAHNSHLEDVKKIASSLGLPNNSILSGMNNSNLLRIKLDKEYVNESFEKLVSKLEKQGKSKKAATAIAGAVANYKAKGGGKGPTAKQK